MPCSKWDLKSLTDAVLIPVSSFSLGSRLSTIDRLTPTPVHSASSSTTAVDAIPPDDESFPHRLKRVLVHLSSEDAKVPGTERSRSNVQWLRAHLMHASIDM